MKNQIKVVTQEKTELPKLNTRQLIVLAAKKLLAERPPSMITVKQISSVAHIQHSLIYHYFETKDALFLEAMNDYTSEYIADRSLALRSGSTKPYRFSEHEDFWKACAHFSADGGNAYAAVGWNYPVLTYELKNILANHPEIDETVAKALVIRQVSLGFAWVLFRDTFKAGMKIDDVEMEEIERQLSQIDI